MHRCLEYCSKYAQVSSILQELLYAQVTRVLQELLYAQVSSILQEVRTGV